MNERSKVISRLLANRLSREAYIGAKLKVLIPSQIRALRLKSRTPRQTDLANATEMKQSRISAMETPGAVNFNLETLVRLAAALKVGLRVEFVSFSEMLDWENRFSQDEFNPATIDRDTDFQREKPTVVIPVTSQPFEAKATSARAAAAAAAVQGQQERQGTADLLRTLAAGGPRISAATPPSSFLQARA